MIKLIVCEVAKRKLIYLLLSEDLILQLHSMILHDRRYELHRSHHSTSREKTDLHAFSEKGLLCSL